MSEKYRNGVLIVVCIELILLIILWCLLGVNIPLETGDRVYVVFNGLRNNYSLQHGEDGLYYIRDKNETDADNIISFFTSAEYGQYSIRFLMQDYVDRTSVDLVSGKSINLHMLAYGGDSAVLFWVPDSSTGVYLYCENDDDMSKMQHILDQMKIYLTKSNSKGSEDPFEEIKLQVQGRGAEMPAENGDSLKIYWKVPEGYAEGYSCEYFKSYTKDSINVRVHYEATDQDLEVLESGEYSSYNFDSVNIWLKDGLYFVEAESRGSYQYECMTKDGNVYMDIDDLSGGRLAQEALGNIVQDFLSK